MNTRRGQTGLGRWLCFLALYNINFSISLQQLLATRTLHEANEDSDYGYEQKADENEHCMTSKPCRGLLCTRFRSRGLFLLSWKKWSSLRVDLVRSPRRLVCHVVVQLSGYVCVEATGCVAILHGPQGRVWVLKQPQSNIRRSMSPSKASSSMVYSMQLVRCFRQRREAQLAGD